MDNRKKLSFAITIYLLYIFFYNLICFMFLPIKITNEPSWKYKKHILQVCLCLCAMSVSTLNTLLIEYEMTKYVRWSKSARVNYAVAVLSWDSPSMHCTLTPTRSRTRTPTETTNGENIISLNIFWFSTQFVCERAGTRCCCGFLFLCHRFCLPFHLCKIVHKPKVCFLLNYFRDAKQIK